MKISSAWVLDCNVVNTILSSHLSTKNDFSKFEFEISSVFEMVLLFETSILEFEAIHELPEFDINLPVCIEQEVERNISGANAA